MSRYLIASGTQHYRDPGADLEEVPAELARIRALFVERAGYQVALEEQRLDPETDSFRRELESWLRHHDRAGDDTVVIYYTGHGFERDGIHYLATASTEANLVSTAVPSDSFLRFLGSDAAVRRLLVIFDVCYSGVAARDVLTTALRSAAYWDQREYAGDEGIWVVSAARARDTAQQGIFSTALAEAYDALVGATPASQRYLSFDSLFELIRRAFERKGVEQRASYWTVSGAQGLPPFLPNPHYDQQDPTAALYATAPGVADVAVQAPRRFVGRAAALAALSTWRPGVNACVVTGRPGSGKSALLAEFVGRATDQAIVAVQARGKTAAALAEEVGAALGVDLHHADAIDLAAPVTVVVDSLDESLEPSAIARSVLRPLAPEGEAMTRLIVGCRTNSLPALPFAARAVDLDDAEFSREEDVAEYVASRLLAGERFAADAREADRIGAAVARRAAGSFAIASIVAESLAAADALPTDAELDAIVPGSLASAFEADLDRWGDDALRVRDLLAPLAWAQGAGLPWETLWAPLATALARHGACYDDADVRWLLERARAYVLETQVGGRTVFRVFHEELAAHLRASYEGTPADANGRVLTTLLAAVPTDASGRREWAGAASYALGHLPSHAVAAGRMDALLTDVGFLVAADVDGVVPALAGAHSTDAERAATVYSIGSDRLRHASGAERAAILGLVARQQGEVALAERFAPLAEEARWVSRWADWVPAATHRTLARLPSPIGALAASTASGRPLVAMGDRAGAIRIVDLGTGRIEAELDVGASVSALAWLTGDHPFQLAAGDRRGTLHLWRGLDEEPVRIGAHDDEVRAVAELVLGGRPTFVTGGHAEWSGRLRAWDARSLEPVGPEFDAFAGAVGTVDAIEYLGEPAILAAGDPLLHRDPGAAGQLRVFDPRTGELRTDIRLSPYDYARTIAVEGEEVLVAWGRRIERWRIPGAVRLASVDATPHAPSPATLLRGDGMPVIATLTDGGVDFLDARWLSSDPSRARIDHPQLEQVASLEFEGSEAVVAAGFDRTVRVWDPSLGRTTGQGRPRGVRSIAACGTSLIAVSDPGVLEVRAPGSGRVIDRAPAPHTHTGLMAVCARDGRALAFSATEDNRISSFTLPDPAHGTVAWETPGRLTAIAAHAEPDRVLVATATGLDNGRRTAVQLWDGDTGGQLGVELSVSGAPDKSIMSLAFASVRGEFAILATGGSQLISAWAVGEALTWRPTVLLEGPPDRLLASPHDDYIRRIVPASAREHVLLLSAGDDGRLAGVDLATGQPAFCVDHAHDDWIMALGVGQVGALPVAATGDRTGMVKVWSLSDQAPELLAAVVLEVGIIDLAIVDGAVHAATTRGLLALDIRGHP